MEDPPRKQRLIIKEMVLENFKSYAGRQVIGPFHKVRHGEYTVVPGAATWYQ